ncbi:MAG: tetratricopeptide repeat protein, partial [bacterium]
MAMENMLKMLPKYFFVLLVIMHVSSAASAKTALPAHEDSKPLNESSQDSLEGKEAEAKSHFQKGLEFSQIGKVDLAIHEYNKALELDPNLSMAHVNLGMSYIFKKEFDQAVDELKKAIMQNPELKIAHYNLWWAYRQQQKYDLGIAELKKIITMDPNEVDAYKNLGDTYLSDKKMIAEAIVTYARGLEKDKKDISLHQKLGKAYELSGEWEKSIKHLQQAIDLQIDDPYNYLFLYVTLKKVGKDSEAKEIVGRALSMLDKKFSVSSPSSSGYSEIRH